MKKQNEQTKNEDSDDLISAKQEPTEDMETLHEKLDDSKNREMDSNNCENKSPVIQDNKSSTLEESSCMEVDESNGRANIDSLLQPLIKEEMLDDDDSSERDYQKFSTESGSSVAADTLPISVKSVGDFTDVLSLENLDEELDEVENLEENERLLSALPRDSEEVDVAVSSWESSSTSRANVNELIEKISCKLHFDETKRRTTIWNDDSYAKGMYIIELVALWFESLRLLIFHKFH